MSEPSFTPGPWEWEGAVLHSASRTVATLARPLDEMAVANAYLLRAAPKLYEALENLAGDVFLFSVVGDGPEGREIGWDQVCETQAKALVALAEARGET